MLVLTVFLFYLSVIRKNKMIFDYKQNFELILNDLVIVFFLGGGSIKSNSETLTVGIKVI